MSFNPHMFEIAKPPVRDESAQRQATQLMAEGYIVGMSSCLRCFAVSSMYFNDRISARDLITIVCPKCGWVGSVFLPDDECLGKVCPEVGQ